MHTIVSFEAAWRDLNRRSAVLWLLFFGCIPGMVLLAYLLSDLFSQDGRDRLGWKPDGKFCMSPLHPGVFRGAALFLAADARLRSLPPAEIGQRHTAGGNRRQRVSVEFS
jgi:hypothetical protein